MANFPILPLTARTEVSFTSQFTPVIYQQDNGYADRKSKDYRKVDKGSISLSTYTDDLKTINDFLHSRSGYKPFRFQQDNKLYFCSSWTNTFVDGNRGNIQMQLTRYTNEA